MARVIRHGAAASATARSDTGHIPRRYFLLYSGESVGGSLQPWRKVLNYTTPWLPLALNEEEEAMLTVCRSCGVARDALVGPQAAAARRFGCRVPHTHTARRLFQKATVARVGRAMWTHLGVAHGSVFGLSNPVTDEQRRVFLGSARWCISVVLSQYVGVAAPSVGGCQYLTVLRVVAACAYVCGGQGRQGSRPAPRAGA